MELFVSIVHHSSLLVKASTNVGAGWRKNERGYGFFARGGIPHPSDRSLEFTMNIRVRPHQQFSSFTDFPEGLRASGDLPLNGMDGFGIYVVQEGKAAVLIAIGALRDHLEREEGKPLRFDP